MEAYIEDQAAEEKPCSETSVSDNGTNEASEEAYY